MLILLGVIAVFQVPASAPAERDDVAVYAAVIEHTLRAEFRKMGNSGNVPLVGRTVKLCDEKRDRELPCVRMGEFDLSVPSNAPVTGTFELNDAARAELASSFAARNGDVHALPSLTLAGVTILTDLEFRAEQREIESGRRGAFAGFSRPAYSTDGHALVYAFNVCGNLCGHGWLFLLSRSGDGWRVQGTRLLWIS